jgi:hypothetical protein
VKSWNDNIDPSTIPDEVLKRERAKRNAAKRTTYSGGVIWAEHNPVTPRCRCQQCMDRREAERAQPKRPRGRPRKEKPLLPPMVHKRGRPRKQQPR